MHYLDVSHHFHFDEYWFQCFDTLENVANILGTSRNHFLRKSPYRWNCGHTPLQSSSERKPVCFFTPPWQWSLFLPLNLILNVSFLTYS